MWKALSLNRECGSNSNGFFGYNFIDIIDLNIIPDIVQLTLDNNVAVVPTQTLFTRWFSPDDPAEMMKQPEMKYMPSQTRFAWRQSKTRMINDPSYNPDNGKNSSMPEMICLRRWIVKRYFSTGFRRAPSHECAGFSLHHEMSGYGRCRNR